MKFFMFFFLKHYRILHVQERNVHLKKCFIVNLTRR